MAQKVVVGMSGGVDSSVAAYLLQLQGYEVIGVTVRVWDPEEPVSCERDNRCCGETAVDDARRVCIRLGIPYHVVGFRERFRERVIDPFVAEYLGGRTPNPCLQCNRLVKWEAILSQADALGARYVATWHYARIERLSNGRYTVCNAASAAKDQTYALSLLTQEQLVRTLMPLGDYHKSEVRRIAKEAGLPVAGKPDSEDICFIRDGDVAGFVDRAAGDAAPGPGRFVYRDGTDLGKHRGITHYTVGQRRGLGLAMGRPVFVTGLDAASNTVRIGEAEDVLGDTLVCRGLNFMALAPDELAVGDVLGLREETSSGTDPYSGAQPVSVEGQESPTPGAQPAPEEGKESPAPGPAVQEIPTAEPGVPEPPAAEPAQAEPLTSESAVPEIPAAEPVSRRITCRIRYSAASAPCRIKRTGEDEITARFYEKVRAITPGQEAVFYEDGHVLCAGTIAP